MRLPQKRLPRWSSPTNPDPSVARTDDGSMRQGWGMSMTCYSQPPRNPARRSPLTIGGERRINCHTKPVR